MSVNDDMVQASSDSFWEVGKYMRTVRRCDNGYKLCDHLRSLIESRAEIEKKYASMLSAWSKKWNEFLDRGPEYGTGLAAWRGVLSEADQVSDLHTDIADRLMLEVHASIKAWQKESYHKSMMHFKETKEFEDRFRKAQKPWGKRLQKVLAARKEYHTACRTEKSTANQENNARGDASVSADTLRKLQEKLRKCQQEVEGSREKYQACLNDLNGYNAKYIEDMTEGLLIEENDYQMFSVIKVYDECQDFERKRIDFFKKALFDVHKCLDLSVDHKFARVYTDLHATIANTEPNQDLKYWSNTHGVDMPMAWPQFEEYSPELQAISKRGKGQVNTGEGGITITSIRHAREDSFGSYNADQPPAYSASTAQQQNSSAGSRSAGGSGYAFSLNPFGDDDDEEEAGRPGSKGNATKSNGSAQASNGGENPFGDADLDGEEEGVDLDENSQGWAVRALYDYDKAEDDEIGFRQGDVFVQMTTEDEMGWCKGRKDGIIGLFPSNYVERI